MSATSCNDSQDAIEMLRSEHRRVEAWFEEFQDCRSIRREEEIAALICETIRRHSKIDARLFYPAFLEATGDEYRCNAMLSEDRDINDLIDEIESSSPAEDSFFAKIHLLCRMFAHHVRQEEKERGIFNEALHSGLDADSLGRELADSLGPATDPKAAQLH